MELKELEALYLKMQEKLDTKEKELEELKTTSTKNIDEIKTMFTNGIKVAVDEKKEKSFAEQLQEDVKPHSQTVYQKIGNRIDDWKD